MKKLITVFAAMLISAVVLSSPAQALTNVSGSYVLDEDGKHVTIPVLFEAKQVISDFKVEGSYNGLNDPKDLFADKNGYYIADTGNNRILVTDKSFKVVRELTEADGISFSSPTGVSTDSLGDIYIADTGNSRVVHFSNEGEYIESFVKPESDLLYDVEVFSPAKVEFDPISNLLYVIQGKQFMTIDAANKFKGYIGDNRLSFDLWDYIFRKFATEKQKMQTQKREPESYTNFCMSGDGKLYAVGLAPSQRISIINTVGNNIYPSGDYGETLYESDGTKVTPIFSDIAVNSKGIIFVAEENTSCIYQYDQNGNLVGVFGGKGSGSSSFNVISSIAVNDKEELVTLDSALGRIQVFSATEFTNNVHKALLLNKDGKYSQSYELWQKVKEQASNYTLARNMIGKIEYKNGNYNDAKKEFYQGDDRADYSKAFSKLRYAFFRDHFELVAVAVVIFVVLVIVLIKLLQKYLRRLRAELWREGGGR